MALDLMALDGREQPFRLLIHDRVRKFSRSFDEVFRSECSTSTACQIRFVSGEQVAIAASLARRPTAAGADPCYFEVSTQSESGSA
jgi:hypothetical protein